MDVYIKTKEEAFHFPVNPFSISVNGSKVYDTFDIMYKGEVDFLTKKAKKIKTLNLVTEFPKEHEPYCRYEDIPDPTEAIKKIDEFCNAEEPIRLIITEYNFNELVNLVDYSDDEDGNYQGDKRVSLDFRIVNGDGVNGIKTIKKDKKKSPAPSLKNRPSPKKNKIHVVKSGDTLWKIAKKTYGNGAQYNKIYNANKKVVGGNPNIIKPGQKLVLP